MVAHNPLLRQIFVDEDRDEVLFHEVVEPRDDESLTFFHRDLLAALIHRRFPSTRLAMDDVVDADDVIAVSMSAETSPFCSAKTDEKSLLKSPGENDPRTPSRSALRPVENCLTKSTNLSGLRAAISWTPCA